jgi:hypothetical protein
MSMRVLGRRARVVRVGGWFRVVSDERGGYYTLDLSRAPCAFVACFILR